MTLQAITVCAKPRDPNNLHVSLSVTHAYATLYNPPKKSSNHHHHLTQPFTTMGFINPGADSWGRTKSVRTKPHWKKRIRLTTTTTTTPKPRPLPRARASLLSLPTELIQSIFLLAPSGALPQASRLLASVIGGRHLQLQYVRLHCVGYPSALERVFAAPWFSVAFLMEYEGRYGRLDATGVELPTALLVRVKAALVVELVARGGRWGAEAADAVQEALVDGVENGEQELVKAVLEDPGVVVGRPAMRAMAKGWWGVEWLERFVERGGDVNDVGVWRAALEGASADVLEWLIARGPPPGEVLGEVMMAGRP